MKQRLFVAPLLIAAMGSTYAQSIITTVAGADWTFTGNGKPALKAPLGNVSGIAVDPRDGNPVFLDQQNAIVAKILSDGTLSVIAGNGFNFSSGDGDPANGAGLTSPESVAFDAQGNLYIGGTRDIRKVSTTGIITTLATINECCLYTYVSVAADNSGNVYYSDSWDNQVWKIAPDLTVSPFVGPGVVGSPGGPTISATLSSPSSIAFDATGNLYIADTNNNAIRKVSGGTVTTVFPNANNPVSIAFDSTGAMYVATISGAIFKAPPSLATLTQITLTGGTIGASPSIAPDNSGNIYVADFSNSQVKRVSASGVVTVLAGDQKYRLNGKNTMAVNAVFNSPAALAVGTDGSLYVSDTGANRVYKIDPKGFLTTFANIAGPLALDSSGNLYVGSGAAIYQVTQTGVTSPYATIPICCVTVMAIDPTANLYVWNGSNTFNFNSGAQGANIYKVDQTGKSTVYAGTGVAGFSGDGGPANSAQLIYVEGLAMDVHGNLLIAEEPGGYAVGRIRQITPQRTISTLFAGINPLGGIAVNSAGDVLYFSDAIHPVLSMNPYPGGIVAFAGTGAASPGDGLPATQVQIGRVAGIAVDSAGNVFFVDTGHKRIREVLATPPTMQVSTANLAFTAASTGAPVTQNILVNGSVNGLQFGLAISECSTSPCWLTADTSLDQTPRSVAVTANPISSLAPGTTYTATVTITPVAAVTPAAITVTVTFTVTPAQAPQLSVDTPELSFTLPVNAAARTSTLLVSNLGGGTISYTAIASTSNGGNWLVVSPASPAQVALTPGQPSALSVTANPGTLPPGVYSGQVSIQAPQAGNVVVPVIMTVSSNPQAVLLTQTGMSFTAVSAGGVIPQQSFGVLNAGTGVMCWSAAATTTGGGNWLAISYASAPSCPSGSGSTDPTKAAPQIAVSINTANLPPAGVYYGTVRVTAPGTANGTREITVYLNVLPAGTFRAASVQPTELVFYTTTAADDSPGSQPLNVYNIAAAPRSFSSQASTGLVVSGPSQSTLPGYFPFSTVPTTGTLDPQQPTEVVVQPGCQYCTGVFSVFSTAGTYNSDALTFQFDDGTVQTVKVTVVSTPPGASPAFATESTRRAEAAGTNCAPLVVAAPTLTEGFSVNAGWPNAITATVTDSCNNPLTAANGGNVSVQFSDQTTLNLQSLNNGIWQRTWKTANTATTGVSLTISASANGGIPTIRKFTGQSIAQSNAPQISLTSMATVAAAFPPAPFLPSSAAPTPASNPVTSPLTVIAPGSLLAIYAASDGPPLADSTATASLDQPLPKLLGGASVYFDNLPAAPIYYASPGLLYVLVPYGVNVNTSSQIVVSHPNAVGLSVPVGVNVAVAQPMVLGIMDTTSGSLVGPGSSVAPGDTLVIYCVGLGATSPSLADGVVTPSGQVYSVVAGVSVTMGGQPVAVPAQLVPGYVGLYQITVTIPTTVSAATVPSSITVAGQTTPLVSAPPTGGTGAANYYFSDLVFAGGFQTTLTLTNDSPQSVTCTTNFYSDSGGPLAVPFSQGSISARTDVLPSGNSIHDQTIASLTAPVAEGWAQSSCTRPIEASLLYRYYANGVATSEAGVNAETAPTTSFVTFAQTATGVAYANPSTTQTATVTFTVMSNVGAPLGSTSITLGPLAHGAQNISTLFPSLISFTGMVEITSTIPIISLSLNAEAFPVISSLPPGDLPSGFGGGGGPTNYYFSDLAFAGGFQTTLTLINYSPQAVTCTTNFYSDAGAPLSVPFNQGSVSTRSDVLPPGGSIHDQTIASLTAPVAQGWAQSSCTGLIQASLLYRFYTNEVATSEAGVNAETAPTTKFVTFAQTATGIAYANPSATQSAIVTFSVISNSGVRLGTTSITLAPLAHGAANLGPLLSLQNFTGSVEITSTIPIISLSLNAEAFPVISSLPPGDLSAATTLY